MPPAGRLVAAVLCLLLTQLSAPAKAGETAIQCYNQALGTVQETLARDCGGRIVSDEEAAEIRKARRAYIQKIYSAPRSGLVEGKRLSGQGSGFFVAWDGSVITSHHVVDDCEAISITPTFGEMSLATIAAFEAPTDLALLRGEFAPPAVAPLVERDTMPILGETFVIGYPERGLVTIEPVLSAVEVLYEKRETERGPAIIVRGDVRQGNSGGPLLSGDGSVLGVVFAKVDSVSTYKATGEVVQDIGLVRPGDVLKNFLAANNVAFRTSHGRPPQPADRIFEGARPFLVQVGCWR